MTMQACDYCYAWEADDDAEGWYVCPVCGCMIDAGTWGTT